MKIIYLLFALAVVSPPAFAQVEIADPWAHATPPAARVAGGYLVIRNPGAVPDRLIGARSPASGRVELHSMNMEAGVMKMRELADIPVPAGGTVQLRRGQMHLMFINLHRPFKAGDAIPVTLRFERAGERRIELHVRPLEAGAHHK